MLIKRKDKLKTSIINPTGEHIYEMINNEEHIEMGLKYSLEYVEIPKNCSTRHHYHPDAEEVYYILNGRAKVVVNKIEYIVGPGDAVFIEPSEEHQLFTEGKEKLVFVVFCSVARGNDNTIYLD